jgi:toxin ParE1/3/4
MAYRIVWSAKAVEDVDAIATYIARDSPFYAAAVVQKILDITRHLNDSPLTSCMTAELGDATIREQFAYSYRIIYLIQDEVVTILAVIQTRRLSGTDK